MRPLGASVKVATGALPEYHVVLVEPAQDLAHYATKPVHRCHDICSAHIARIS